MDRRDTRVRVTMEVEDADTLEPLGTTRDLSQTGFFLLTKRRWQVGQEMDLRILHGAEPLVVRARVARTKENGVGFFFIELSAQQEQTIHRMLLDMFAEGARFDDRRKAVRARGDWRVTWSVGERETDSELIDLSPKGACVVAENPPEVGAEIAVSFKGPTGSTEVGRAKVVHRTAGSFGVEFLEPSKEFAKAVRDLLVDGSQ